MLLLILLITICTSVASDAISDAGSDVYTISEASPDDVSVYDGGLGLLLWVPFNYRLNFRLMS